MVKRTKKKDKNKQISKYNTPIVRFIIILLIGVAVFVIWSLSNHKNTNNNQLTARKAGDEFMTAYVNCDISKVKASYLAFQEDEAKLAKFKKDCHQGDVKFKFDKIVGQGNGGPAKRDGENAYIQYTVTGKTIPGDIMLTLVWSAKDNQWFVFIITPL